MASRTALLVMFLLFTFAAPAQTMEKPMAAAKVEDLAWLAGCWETKNAAKQLSILEQWMVPEGGAMLGMSRTVRGGKMAGYEFLRIVRDDVSVKYVSRPSENTTDTDFRVIKLSPNEVIFSNPQHDFPQRIIYRRDGDNLTARIEGTTDGKTRGIDFPYRRVACN